MDKHVIHWPWKGQTPCGYLVIDVLDRIDMDQKKVTCKTCLVVIKKRKLV